MLAQQIEWSNARQEEFRLDMRAVGLEKVGPIAGKKYRD
jgi:hypothetical protein